MPLTYSIGDGLTIGVLVYVVLNILNNIFTKGSSKKKPLSKVMIALAFVFIFKLILPLIS